jgi:pyruvate/2-oxoglutarate dehydrogenase complex dihydrolipoamide dehydrogenase (E3) component
MPTKALLYAAEVLRLASHPEPWGIRTEGAGFDFAKVMAHKNALVKEFADHRRLQLTDGRFKFIRANVRFADPHTLETDNGDRVSAAHFVIATGSVVAPYPLPQLDEAGCLNSDTALELAKLPRSIIVLGGGAVAVEFAQFFARFGVKVALIQRGGRLLREFDTDAALEIEKVFRREGVEVFTNTRLVDARRLGGLKEVAFQHDGRTIRMQAEEIFFALGRVPNVAPLGLDRIGVRTEGGRIATNPRMQTSVPHIYAAGDCTGPHEIVHLAVQQGEIAAQNIAHPEAPREMDCRLRIAVVFTEPQVAAAGLTEKKAQASGVAYLAASHPFSDHGKSLIMEAKDGFVKLLADPKSGEILGGACIGPLGGELIHEVVVAMSRRMTVHELAATPHYHPTLAEIWTYPAEDLAGRIAPAVRA